MNTFTSGWYLVYTRPRQENKVVNYLSQKQINHFLPKVKTVRQWHDRKKVVNMPLFPSYVFVNLSSEKDFYNVLNVDGVCSYVKHCNKAVIVPDNILLQMDLFVQNGEQISVSEYCFQAGQNLQIENGSLTGLSCEVVQFDGKDKILVRVDLLNRNLLVDLPLKYLSLMSAAIQLLPTSLDYLMVVS